MKEYTTQKIRNIALIGHGSSGKTTLTEAMLFYSKAIGRRGSVADGTTVTDFDEEEIRRHISLNTAMAPVEWKDCKINVLDTPGYTDFIGEVRCALRVADMALLVIDAAAGVEVGTELTWGYASDEKISRAVLINKMDRENANFDRALASLEKSFDAQFRPLMLPVGAQAAFAGVVNLLDMQAYMGPKCELAAIPADLADQVEEFRVPAHPTNVHLPLIDDFARALVEGRAPQFDGHDAIQAQRIMEGCYRSSQAGSVLPV